MDKDKINDIVSEVDPIDLRVALFKKGDFDFIVTGKNEHGEICTHEKQKEALQILTMNVFSEFLFGGAAGGAKSWTGCSWLFFMCLCYPNTRYFIGRNELKDILDSVYVTFIKVCREYGFIDFKFNAVKNFIQFGNGSHINFIELKYKPSDPMYEDVGSTEYTAGWIEEVGEIHETAATVISSRVGRHMNNHYGIKGMTFYTCNPKKNWAKREFYDKWLKKKLEPYKQYLPCFVTDNPFIEDAYIENLKRIGSKNKAIHERLFKGNWDYEENLNALCDYEMIEQIFTNDHVEQGKTYITADIARFGSDKAIIGVWRGWRLIDVTSMAISKTTEIEHAIRLLRRKFQIPKNRCIADEDGVGGGVVDGTGILGFVNNAKPLKEAGVSKSGMEVPSYRNLQIQCLYHLADKVNEGGLWITADINGDEKDHIMQELDQIQSKNNDNRKLDCKNKADIKLDIGRSPDWRDLLLMRVYFDLKPKRKAYMGARKRDFI